MKNLLSMIKNKISNSIFNGFKNPQENVCSDSNYTNEVINNIKKFVDDNLINEIFAKQLFQLFKSYDIYCKSLKHFESSNQLQSIINNCQFDKKSYLLDLFQNIDLLHNIQFFEFIYDACNENNKKYDNIFLNYNWFISFILYHKFNKYTTYLESLNIYYNQPDKFLSRIRLDLGNDTCDILFKIYGNNLINNSGRFNQIIFSKHLLEENSLLLNKINLLDSKTYSNKSIIPKLKLIPTINQSKKRSNIEVDNNYDNEGFIPVKRMRYDNNLNTFSVDNISINKNSFIPKKNRTNSINTRSYASVVKNNTEKDLKEEGEISDNEEDMVYEIEETQSKVSPRRKRTLTGTQKKNVVSRQSYKCANKPGSNCIKDYECPIWKSRDGIFDESGYEIDHIIEFSVGGSDELENCQALCLCCHRVKTIRFLINRNKQKTNYYKNNNNNKKRFIR